MMSQESLLRMSWSKKATSCEGNEHSSVRSSEEHDDCATRGEGAQREIIFSLYCGLAFVGLFPVRREAM